MDLREHERLQFGAQAATLQAMFAWHCEQVQSLLLALEPHKRMQCLREMLCRLDYERKAYLHMTFPEMSAEYSDLWAAEAQEAFEKLASQVARSITSAGRDSARLGRMITTTNDA
jgi:hypothetical protein